MTLDMKRPMEAGRTWRDLPPEPPLGEPLDPVPPAPLPVTPAVAAVATRRAPRWPWAVGALVFVLGLIAMLALVPTGSDEGTGTTVPPVTTTTEAITEVEPDVQPVPETGSVPGGVDEPVADVAAALMPSVVQLESGFGLGSGFIYDESGLIFTAAHVVAGANEVTVRLTDGRTVVGEVIGRDDDRDVAVVKIDASGLVAAQLIDEEVRVGQTAIAIGSPFGFDRTVTAGIVSALDRSLSIEGRSIEGLIQTDAAINQGNSGGPLADATGRVIGINIAIASASGGSNGVGFAVPIDVALEIASGFDPNNPQVPPTTSNPFGSNPLGDLFGGDPFGQSPFGDGGDFGLDGFQNLLDQFGLSFDLDDPSSLLPEEMQDLLDQLGGLGLDSFNLDDFGLDLPVPGGSVGALLDANVLPPGYTVADQRTARLGDVDQQVTTATGPEGTLLIRGSAGGSTDQIVASAPGRNVDVHGATGKIDDSGDSIRLVWLEDGVAVEIIAPGELGADVVLDVAGGIEVLS